MLSYIINKIKNRKRIRELELLLIEAGDRREGGLCSKIWAELDELKMGLKVTK